MDNLILDYDESLNDLERQKEQLELVMQKMGEEWEKSGPGINWLRMLQHPKAVYAPTTAKENIKAVTDDEDMAPDGSLETNDKLIDILQQQTQLPSPEYLQSLLHVNETLLAQSLAASPMMDGESSVARSNANITALAIASPQSVSSSDICTPGLNSISSAPITPDDENDKPLHLPTNQQTEQEKD